MAWKNCRRGCNEEVVEGVTQLLGNSVFWRGERCLFEESTEAVLMNHQDSLCALFGLGYFLCFLLRTKSLRFPSKIS